MTDYKLEKFNSTVSGLKDKYPNTRATPYIDKMKGETWDSNQGKMSSEYEKAVQELNAPGAGSGRGNVNPSIEGKKKGGVIKSASNRADGIACRGKTRGTMVKHGK